MEIGFGIPSGQERRVAEIFYEAFGYKFTRVFGSAEVGVLRTQQRRDQQGRCGESRGREIQDSSSLERISHRASGRSTPRAHPSVARALPLAE